MKIYHYPACSTCKRALAFLRGRGLTYEELHIVDTPPTRDELLEMGAALNGEFKKLFNTSGELYRELGLKDRISSMSQADMVELLTRNGKLIKRPFLISERVKLVGFREDAWITTLGNAGKNL
jgi:Spx/MgsR family transcriptional regulator